MRSARILACVRVRAALQDDRLHMTHCAFERHTYSTDTAMDAPRLDTVFRDPLSTRCSYPLRRALTWRRGHSTPPVGIGWNPRTLTSKVATVAHIAPGQHFVAFTYADRAIVMRDLPPLRSRRGGAGGRKPHFAHRKFGFWRAPRRLSL